MDFAHRLGDDWIEWWVRCCVVRMGSGSCVVQEMPEGGMYGELSKWWRPVRSVVRNVACCGGAGYGVLLRSVERERMACEMSTLARCLVRVMCALVQWLWRCTLSPCRSW